MLSILYYIWLAAICTVVLVLSVAVLALTYPFQKSRRIVHEMSRYLALSFLLPFPRRVEGLENVDRRERYVIVLNHQAMVDIGALYHVPLNFRWVSKREVFRIPFFGQFLLVHGDICIDRGRAAEALEQLLRDGRAVVVARGFGGDLSGGNPLEGRPDPPIQGRGFHVGQRGRCACPSRSCSTVRSG